MANAFDRFLDKIVKNDYSGCWEWIGSKDAAGYGRFRLAQTNFLAHRIAYQLFVGELDDSLVIHHRCENKSCVNPEHLQQMTKRENTTWGAAYNRRMTHCKRGHEFTEANTYIDKKRARVCLACKHEHYLNGRDGQILRAKWRKLLEDKPKEQVDKFITQLMQEYRKP